MSKISFIAIIFCICLFFSNESVGQQYWQQRISYDIKVDFDVTNHQFSGTETITYFNNSPDTLQNIFIHLYFNAFQPGSMMDVRSRNLPDPDPRVKDRISKLSNDEIGYHEINSLKQNQQNLRFHVQGTVLEAELNEPIHPGDSAFFELTFDSQVPLQIRRSGRNNNEGIDYSMAQWYPKVAEYDYMGWQAHPYVAREFYAPWGDFNVQIAIQKEYVLAATGTLINANEVGYGYENPGQKLKKPSGGKLVWKFQADNVHDFVWTADRNYVHKQALTEDNILLHFFYQETPETRSWEELPGYMVKAFQFIQDRYGKYPYPSYSFIQGGDGGMEYPMATLITGHRHLNSLVGVSVHELLHSWFQGLLATNESYYAWMDEGFTSYAEDYVMEYLFPSGQENPYGHPLKSSYVVYANWAKSGFEEPMITHADHFMTNSAYGRASYTKGAVCLQQLGAIIGDQNLQSGLKKYYYQWRFKHPTSNDFIRVMEKQSNIQLDWYFEYWINSTHTIDYMIDSVYRDNSNNITKVKMIKVGVMPMPVDVWITLNDGSQLIYYAPLDLMRGEKPNETPYERIIGPDWPWTNREYTFELNVPIDQISEMTIDPHGWVADVDPSNNTYSKTVD